ncbi:Glyoxalase/bleomycin resistance protein/dioxygenase [Brachyspira intermedia PWS/A]|uniref:Glyoxalase/bleomycin resistance protein/dioxygenase n=1 Tax=Brachyspira intermedia (strain ATCC 51140 / PWS/A) TaxID=1045858 RepID=G0ELE9_BRAIP|nr:glyoxalase/bleomycin resistance protein/dioxygenase [Brachyspira intermedia]AEM22725.1 Glyoxalase/bleomycin resistance protein/dioxygenase [Brachyspira intermedia PWS/A]
MIIVTDLNKSVEFYKNILELNVIMDFGADKTLTGNLVLKTKDTYKDFIDNNDISFV